VTPVDRSAALQEALSEVRSTVRLVFFEQTLDCDTCRPTRQLLEQLGGMNPQIRLEPLNLILDKDRAAALGVDRVPAVVLSSEHSDRIRFYGAPLGYELVSLVDAIRRTASGQSDLSDESRAVLAGLTRPVSLQVFFTPMCGFCPAMVGLANRFAIASPLVSTAAIDATEYPDLVRRYNVNGVPKTVINDSIEIVGAVSEADLARAIEEAVAD
jgi:glutaredoxin-like protein